MEVVKEKRWLFEQIIEVKKKIMVTEMNCGSSNKKQVPVGTKMRPSDFFRRWDR